ncbi:MAG: alpha/beta fold hydrolase, partial [Bacteroidota bacterium]
MKIRLLFITFLIVVQAAAQNIPQKGNLGVQLSSAPKNEYEAIFAIAGVSKGSTAESLGLQPNDVLVELNGILFDDGNKIPQVIGKFVVGEKVMAKVLRDGQLKDLTGQVQARPPFKKPNHELQLLEVPFRDGYVRAYLTHPKGEGPFPTIYYIQGYPCQSIDNHPQSPILQLTAGLVDLGYAVFRIEKPGVGEFSNLSPCMEYSFDDELENFRNGLSFLQNLKGVDRSKIYLFGHSLGGNVASILGQDSQLAGAMVYGTLVKPWEDYLLDMAYYSQTQAENPVSVDENISLLKSANHKLYNKQLDHTNLSEKEKELLSAWHDYKADGTVFNRQIAFWQNFSKHNYIKEWSKVNIPVLVIYGESDAHAISALDSELIAQTVNAQHEGKATFMLLENTNHLFANVPSRAKELENINNGLSGQVALTQFNHELPGVLDNWINKEKEASAQRIFDNASSFFPKSETQMSSMDVVAVDVNKDGHKDIILATEFGPNKLFIFKEGKWKSQSLPQLKEYTAPYLGEDSEDIAVADFNKDGSPDLFFVSEDTKHHELLLNDGRGNFSMADFQIAKKGQANAVLTHDFNQDGWPDILIGIRGQNELYINNKGKGFTENKQTVGELQESLDYLRLSI